MRKTYTKPVKADRLGPELLAALPALQITLPSGDHLTRYQLSQTPTTATLDMPDDIDMATVDAVLAAHDGTTPTPAEIAAQQAAQAAAQQATQDTTDLSTLKAQAAADLAAISSESTAIDTDSAAVDTALGLLSGTWDLLTPLQRTQGLQGLLNRQRAILGRQKTNLGRTQRLYRAGAVLVRRAGS